MPLHWKILDRNKLVTIEASGSVSREDIERYLDAVVVVNALPYRKLFNLSGATVVIDDDDMMLLGARMRAYPALSRIGPLAIAAETELAFDFALRFTNLASVDRKAKVFARIEEARTWLMAQPTP